jgi:cytochrome P450
MGDAGLEAPAFPMPRASPFDPPDVYARLRREQPVSRVTLFDGTLAWIATRYEDVRKVCTDPRFSAVPTHPGYPEVFSGRTSAAVKERTFFGMDPPEHDVHRRMLTPAFMVKRAEAIRDDIQLVVDGLLDDMTSRTPPVDLVSMLALPLPTAVICTLLGIPSEDHEFFQARTAERLNILNPPEVVERATSELMRYFDRQVALKEREPGDDLISQLLAEQVQHGTLSRHDLVDMARLLLIAGHDTTANMISMSTLVLLQHPDQLQELQEDPSLIRGAVEELLRYLTLTQTLVGRVALEDVEVGGELIRAGEGVRALLQAANRDPDAFPDPERFDIHRDAQHHVAFGYGVHQCLGQPYARVEMQVALTSLFRRIPNLRLAVSIDELSFKYESAVQGLHALPITW